MDIKQDEHILEKVNVKDLKIVDDATNSSIMIEKFVEQYEESNIFYIFYKFKQVNGPLFIWVSEANAPPALNDLLVSMKTPMDNVPAVSDLFSSHRDNNSNSIIKRIVMKYNTQVYLSYNISQEIPAFAAYAEKRLFELLKLIIQV